MRSLSRCALVCWVVATAPPGAADVGNRNYLPFGERASMLGNVGFTSPQGEAVYYNPANLGRIDYPSLSVSGSTFLLYELSSDRYVRIEGVDQPFSASGFVAIPSSLTSTYQAGQWHLATAILVPEAITFKNRQSYTFGDGKATELVDHLAQSLWLGVGVGRELVPNWYVGASAFIVRDTENDVITTHSQSMMGGVQTLAISIDQAITSATGVLGVQWQPSKSFGVGLRAQLPMQRIFGTQDTWVSVVSVDPAGMLEDSTEQAEEGLRAAKPMPMDVGVGISARPHPRLELMLDAAVQLPGTIITYDGDPGEKLDAAPRVGVGTEIEVAADKQVRLGISYNRSAHASIANGGPGKDIYLGVSAGFSFRRDRTITSLGAFALRSNAEGLISGSDPPERTRFVTLLYGGLIAISYRL